MSIRINLPNVRVSVPGSITVQGSNSNDIVDRIIAGPKGDSIEDIRIDEDMESPTYTHLLVTLNTGDIIDAGSIGTQNTGATINDVNTLIARALDDIEDNDNLSFPDFRVWYEAGKA